MIKVYKDIEQGTPEWHEARRGVITASKIGEMLTAKYAIADNAASRRAVYELASERMSGFTEEMPTTFAMQRGHDDEDFAISLYHEKCEPVERVGFVTNDILGVTIGCSPDALVGTYGGVECKSRLHAIQFETIISGEMPSDFLIQVQTCLLVTGREWWDFLSCPAFGGAKMMVKRIFPDKNIQSLIIDAACECESRVQKVISAYENAIKNPDIRFIDMARREPELSDEVRI